MNPTVRRVVASISLALCLARPAIAASPPGATTADPKAQAVFERGLEQFQAEDYLSAVDSFQTAYELDDKPEYLFAWGQAERLSGDCISAIRLLKRFLATGPSEQHAAAAESILDKCERALGDDAAELLEPNEPTDEPEVEEPQDDATSTEASADPEADAHDSAGLDDQDDGLRARRIGAGVLLGTGVAVASGGLGVLIVASRRHADATTAGDYGGFVDQLDGASKRRVAGGILIGVGAALVTGGALWYGLGTAKDRRVSVAPTLSPRSAGITVRGSF